MNQIQELKLKLAVRDKEVEMLKAENKRLNARLDKDRDSLVSAIKP